MLLEEKKNIKEIKKDGIILEQVSDSDINISANNDLESKIHINNIVDKNKPIEKENQSDINVSDEYGPEDKYDHNDPFYNENPECFYCYNCYETNVEKEKIFNFAHKIIDKNNEIKKECLIKENQYNHKILSQEKKLLIKNNEIISYEKKIRELKNILDIQENKFLDYITNINEKFMESILINKKLFDKISDMSLTIEKAIPKNIHDLINKNLNNDMKEIQYIADKSNKLKNDFVKITKTTLGDKIKQINN